LIGVGAIVVIGLIAAVIASGGGSSGETDPPRSTNEHVREAVEKMDRGDWKGARKELEKALEDDPRDELAHQLLDQVDSHLADDRRAEEHEDEQEEEDEEEEPPPPVWEGEHRLGPGKGKGKGKKDK
jgi:outer membrane protein assembly factor BamD (BamD/ComL family)